MRPTGAEGSTGRSGLLQPSPGWGCSAPGVQEKCQCPPSSLCILPRFPWTLLISSLHRARSCVSRQGFLGAAEALQDSLWCHAAVPRGLAMKINSLGPFLHVWQRRAKVALDLGLTNPVPNTHHKLTAPAFYRHSSPSPKASPCLVSCFPFPAFPHSLG